MIKSMTGFGRCEQATPDYKIVIEMKSVNHRYCDLTIKMPKKFNYFEASIRGILKEYVLRGKIDVFINFEDYTGNKVVVTYNKDIAQGYMDSIQKISEDFGLPADLSSSALSRYPEVLTLEEQSPDENALYTLLEQTLRTAAQGFVQTRIEEGANLKQDLTNKLDALLDAVLYIESRAPMVINDYRTRLTDKVQELLGDTKLDESILATELAVFADKICIDEETVRLKSHIQNMKATLDLEESVGRKLDFIAQEMNREANTILSKSNDLDISNRAIDLKTEIEKIREQIQNIE